MEEQGLASMQQQPAQTAMTIDDVIMMLQQGANPQELVDMGVPVELIRQAIMKLQEQMGAGQGMQAMGQTQPEQQGMGLAGGMVNQQ